MNDDLTNDELEQLKALGISLHVIATGGGARLQDKLWSQPGCSAYLSGASFPYSPAEQEELLGFMPDSFCSENAAIDLASAAYMKSYQWNSKKPVGVGLTASVASQSVHRGDHRVHVCVMTDERVISSSHVLDKAVGIEARQIDGNFCDWQAFETLKKALLSNNNLPFKDTSRIARERFFLRPFFQAGNKRLASLPKVNAHYEFGHFALMSGAFNPPHEAHFGIADIVANRYGKQVAFEITAEPPHKEALTVQQLLQRAKLLQGHNRVFTQHCPLYLDKAKAFPGMPIVMGVDATMRMLDPKWGVDVDELLKGFEALRTKFYISSRLINGQMLTKDDVVESMPVHQGNIFHYLSYPISSEWNVSSSEIRERCML